MTEYLTDYFNRDDGLNKFNNSEILKMHFIYTDVPTGWFGLGITRKFFPFEASNKEIADALRTIIRVPFTLFIGREGQELKKIYRITVKRVFIPN